MNELTIAVLAGLGGMLGWGLADFFAKKTIDKVGDILSLFWGHIFGTLIIGIFLLFRYINLPNQIIFPNAISTWELLLLFGALQAIVYFFAYKGFGKGQLAVLNPIFASYSGIAALLSLLFFKESITIGLFFSLLIIFLGNLMLNLDVNALQNRNLGFIGAPGVREVLTAALLAAIWTVFWDKVVSGEDWLVFAFWMYAFMTITVYCIAKMKKANLEIPQKNLWKFFICIGLFEVGAYIAISLGFSLTSATSMVALLSGAFSLPVIFLARIFLKEKTSLIQLLGSIAIISGIALLSLV